MTKELVIGLSLVFATWSGTTQGVDEQTLEAGQRWQVVGVISGGLNSGKAFGIAVLKNTGNKRTYTVSVGESLPTDGRFTLQAIQGKSVTVTDGSKSYNLDFAEADLQDSETPAESTARFLDSYYRGFEHAAGDANTGYGDGAGGNFPSGTPRYGAINDNSYRSRFELYRPDIVMPRDVDGDRRAVDEEIESGSSYNNNGAMDTWNTGGNMVIEYDADGNVLRYDPQIETTLLNQ